MKEKEKSALKVSLSHSLLPIGIGLSLLLTEQFSGVGSLLIGYGAIAGPSAGHFYLKNTQRAITGALLRSIGIFLIYQAVFVASCEYNCPSNRRLEREFLMIAISGTALVSWSFIKGFLTLKDSARDLYSTGVRLGLLLKPGNDLKSFQVQLSYSF